MNHIFVVTSSLVFEDHNTTAKRRLKFVGLWSMKSLEHGNSLNARFESVHEMREVKCSDWKAGNVELIWKSFAISLQIKLNFVSKLKLFWLEFCQSIDDALHSMNFLDCSISMMKETGSFYVEKKLKRLQYSHSFSFSHPNQTNLQEFYTCIRKFEHSSFTLNSSK